MTDQKSLFEEKFAALKAEYLAQLPEKLKLIAKEWNALKAQHSPDTITLLHRHVHNLIGTSGTFGFSALSTSARSLEELLKPLVIHSTQSFTLDTERTSDITAKIHHLFLLLDNIQNNDDL